jgi:hypothetical protein
MCLTLDNAANVLHHHDARAPGRGYIRTRRHVGHLTPSHQWRPDPEPAATHRHCHRRLHRLLPGPRGATKRLDVLDPSTRMMH